MDSSSHQRSVESHPNKPRPHGKEPASEIEQQASSSTISGAGTESSLSSNWQWVLDLIGKETDNVEKGISYFSMFKEQDKTDTVYSYPSMFTAPVNMRLVDRDNTIFDPTLISIGPFHHNRFPSMEDQKLRFLFCMLYRHDKRLRKLDETQWKELKDQQLQHRRKGYLSKVSWGQHSKYAKEHLMELGEAMYDLKQNIRGSYSKAFPDMDDIQFAKMMVFDGCFMLEVFRLHYGHYIADGDDPIFSTRWMLPELALDFVKLENQIPFVVLEKLYELTRLDEEKYCPLMSLARNFLAFLCPEAKELKKNTDGGESPKHLLALFHSIFIPRGPNTDIGRESPKHLLALYFSIFIPRGGDHMISIGEERNGGMNQQRFSIPSVRDLLLCGIKVVKKKGSRGSNFLDIEYDADKGILEIPTLVIDHSTNTLMRNLVAYEQCDKTVPPIFTSYVTFMDALVNSAEDVEVLRVAGVIDHYMNNNEDVSKLLNNLTASINYDMSRGYLKKINKEIYRRYHSSLSQWKVRFRRLVNSREGVIYIVTIFALYLTLLQTGFSVVSYTSSLSSKPAPK